MATIPIRLYSEWAKLANGSIDNLEHAIQNQEEENIMSKLAIRDLKMNVGMEGFDMEATIQQVFAQRQQTGQYGDYTEQDIIVSDGEEEMDKIKLRLRDHAEVPRDAAGMTILCKSKLNAKQGKKMGVKVKKDSWSKDGQPVSELRIIVTGSAAVKVSGEPSIDLDTADAGERILGEREAMAELPTPPPVQGIRITPSRVSAAPRVAQGSPEDAYNEAIRITENILTEHFEVFQRLKEMGYTEETIRTITTSIVIEINRRNSR